MRLPEFIATVEQPTPGSGAAPRATLRSIAYERDAAGVIQFGRVLAVTDFGDFNGLSFTDVDATDNRTMELEYVPADPSTYLVNLVSAQRLRAGSFGAGTVVREARSFYDEDLPASAPRRGRLTTQIAMSDETNPTTTFGYDDFGNLTRITDPRGATTTLEYETRFQTFLAKSTNALGQSTALSYVADPALCSGTPPIGAGLVFGVRSPNDPSARISRLSYEPELVTVTDENGNRRRRRIDAFGNLTQVEEVTPSETLITRYAYDAAGQLREVIDPAENRTTIEYDLLGRRRRIVDPDAGAKTFEYDAAGTLTLERAEATSTSITFEYEELNRLKRRLVRGQLESEFFYDT